MGILTDNTPQVDNTPPATNTPPVDNTPPVEVPEWLKGVNPEYAKEPSVRNMKSMDDLMKSYIHAQKTIGMDKVVIPSKTATREQWGEFYKRIGHPESLDKYEVGFKKDSSLEESTREVMKKIAFENGILPHQAQGMFDQLEAFSAESRLKMQQNSKAQVDAVVTELKTEWGDGFNNKISNALEAAKKFGGEEFIAHLEASGMGNDKKLIKLLSSIGEALIPQTPKGLDSKTPQEVDVSLDSILSDYNHPYYNTGHIDHAEAVKKVQFLMQKKYK